jgi:hypothetical protein
MELVGGLGSIVFFNVWIELIRSRKPVFSGMLLIA